MSSGMSIRDFLGKCKNLAVKALESDLFLVLVILLVALGSFGLGRLSMEPDKEPIRIEYPKEQVGEGKAVLGVQSGGEEASQGAYVASRTGSKYHLPNCPGALVIKAENKIWFATKADAEQSGYKPAGNCKGL
jgi:hypothetical protein